MSGRHLILGMGIVAAVVTQPLDAQPRTATADVGLLTAPVVAAAPAPAYLHPRESVQRWRRTAMSAGWTPAQWRRLSCIIWRESGGKSSVHNGRDPHGGSLGLLQINAVHVRWLRGKGVLRHFSDLRNPYVNMRAGRLLYEANGWAPWRSSRRPC